MSEATPETILRLSKRPKAFSPLADEPHPGLMLFTGPERFGPDFFGKTAAMATEPLSWYSDQADWFTRTLPNGYAVGDEQLFEELHQRAMQRMKERPFDLLVIDLEDAFSHVRGEERIRIIGGLAGNLAPQLKAGTFAPKNVWIRMRALIASSAEEVESIIKEVRLVLSSFSEAGINLEDINFTVILPKAEVDRQLHYLTQKLDQFEQELGLNHQTKVVLLAETGRAFETPLAQLVDAGDRRVTGIILGTHDLQTSLGIDHTAHSHDFLNQCRMHVASVAERYGLMTWDGPTTNIEKVTHQGLTADDPDFPQKQLVNSCDLQRVSNALIANLWFSIQHGIPHSLLIHPMQIFPYWGVLTADTALMLPGKTKSLRAFLETKGGAVGVQSKMEDPAHYRRTLSWWQDRLREGLIELPDGIKAETLEGTFEQVCERL